MTSGRKYPYRNFKAFAGTLSTETNVVNEITTYGLAHRGDGTNHSDNIITFEDKLSDYTAEFTFKITYIEPSTNPAFNLWMFQGGNDQWTYNALTLIYTDSDTTKFYITNYSQGAIKNTQVGTYNYKLESGISYKFRIIDTGTTISLYICIQAENEEKCIWKPIFENKEYTTALKEFIPPGWKGFGANSKNSATWTNLLIIPSQIDRSILGKSNHFTMPSSFIRNQPIHVLYTENGSVENESQLVEPRNNGLLLLGPANLSSYLGMISRIVIEGTAETIFEVEGIDYQYDL